MLSNNLFQLVIVICFLSLFACGGGGGGDTGESGNGGNTSTTYQVTANAESNGSISPANKTITQGQSTTFTVIADADFSIDTVTGCEGAVSDNTYTTGTIEADCTITATFSADDLLQPIQNYSLSGNVSGLLGSGLVVQNNLTDPTSLTSNGAFSFTELLPDGSSYSVTVSNQPVNPAQVCDIQNSTGTIDQHIVNIEVVCGSPPSDRVDSDNDGLSDAEELAFGTNPTIKDTDGDGFGDDEEARSWDRLGGGHLRLNPLVADVPRIYVRQLGTPVIQLYGTSEQSGTISKGMTNSNSAEVQKTTSRGQSETHVIEEQHTVNINVEVEKTTVGGRARAQASYDYNHNDTTTDTSYWDSTTVATNRNSSSEYFDILKSETVTKTGGEIKVVMGLYNDGDVAWTMQNMEITALMEDPNEPGNSIAVGTLTHKGAFTFTPTQLGRRSNIPDSDLTPFEFNYLAKENPQEISRILENSNLLELRPVNFQLTGQRSDVDLNLASQNVRLRTAEIIIDYGDFSGLENERYRVAIDTTGNSKLDLNTIMSNHLNIAYSSGSFALDDGSVHTGLTFIRNVEANSKNNRYWILLHQFQPAGAPEGSFEFKYCNIAKESYSAADIMLGKNDTLHLAYIIDTDFDGLSDRLEKFYGTDNSLEDTDGDDLDDANGFFRCKLTQRAGFGRNGTSRPTSDGGLIENNSFNFSLNTVGNIDFIADDTAPAPHLRKGDNGFGGGGGGGGAASFGASGGGGGEGGGGGTGGIGGTAGGGSFGMLLNNVEFTEIKGKSTIIADKGGEGGAGGIGGIGGSGGVGGRRSTSGYDGGHGGAGGKGGNGGTGGGGSGGPSSAIILLGVSTLNVINSGIITSDSGNGSGGNPGQGGWNYGIFNQSSATIPLTIADDVTFQLGQAGVNAPEAGNVSP